ncbi:phosphoglycerate mutase family protein [Flavobacterium frigidarium]|uniref:phosphoglycerate mutase family protein n=1 Tax=Flavobacterium frigidarium TaxID=99286 RepID=UPI0004171B85|nr:phosphoglycerate mutase family protein [Flavobacterium frigidarium]
MKKFICLFLLLASITVFGQSNKEIRIVLVRHAEKMTNDPKEKDPELTEKGLQRAEDLAKELADTGVDAVYSTDYKRTRNTAQPTATLNKIQVQIYDANKLKEFAKKVLEENVDKTVLIVGHSNTILETMEALGGTRPIEAIEDHEYDNAFLMLVKADGSINVGMLKYGATSSPTKDPQTMH